MAWIGPYATEELADAACAGSSSSSSSSACDDGYCDTYTVTGSFGEKTLNRASCDPSTWTTTGWELHIFGLDDNHWDLTNDTGCEWQITGAGWDGTGCHAMTSLGGPPPCNTIGDATICCGGDTSSSSSSSEDSGEITKATVWFWLQSGATPTTVEMFIYGNNPGGAGEDGPDGIALFHATPGSGMTFTPTFAGNDREGLGFDIYQVDLGFSWTPPGSGRYWLWLQNADDSFSSGFVFWDVSNTTPAGSNIRPAVVTAGNAAGAANDAGCPDDEGNMSYLIYSGGTVVSDNTNPAFPGTYFADDCIGGWGISQETGQIAANAFDI